LPASTTWVFQDGLDYPRIDISVSIAGVVAPGGSAPEADLASFDMRGPYGVMVFDNGIDGTVKTVLWGDQEFQFKPTQTPVVRDSKWTWHALNKGARYQALLAGGFEMGLFEPAKVAQSATVDGYSAERGYTTKTFKEDGGRQLQFRVTAIRCRCCQATASGRINRCNIACRAAWANLRHRPPARKWRGARQVITAPA